MFKFLLFGLTLSQTNQDFMMLKGSLLLFIAENPTEIVPPLVRISFHDLFNFDPATGQGSPKGCLLAEPVVKMEENVGVTEDALKLVNYVAEQFPNVPFTTGDVFSFAGKVALEVAYPCMKINWRYGRNNCLETTEAEIGPSGNISSLAQMQPFLARYNFTAKEMGILTAGTHSLATSAASPENSGWGPIDFSFANNGRAWIEKSFKNSWELQVNEKNKTQYVSKFNGKELGRLPSDMLFFPSVLSNIASAVFDVSLKDVESYLISFIDKDRSAFDQEFAVVYAKMLEIGTKSSDMKEFIDTSSTSQCIDDFPLPLLYLSGWSTKNILALCGSIACAMLGLVGLIWSTS
jgi:catalase (peroxidase I)